jgi:hypothetical protein
VWDRLVFPNERTQGDAFLYAAAFNGPTYFSKTENGTDDDGAPYALGYFLGDYDGLATVGNAFKPFWTSTQGSTAGKPVLTGGVDTADRTNVFAASTP